MPIPTKLNFALALIFGRASTPKGPATKVERIKALISLILRRHRLATLSKEERESARRLYPDLPEFDAELKYAKWYRKWKA